MKMKFFGRGIFLLIILISGLGLGNKSFSQAIGIGSASFTPAASSILELQATNKGVLITRLTSAQRTGIASPATGLLVYQTNGETGFYYFNGTVWQYLSDQLSDLDANTKVEVEQTANEDIIRMSTAGTERVTIGATGNVGIAQTGPTSVLDVNGSFSLPISTQITNYTITANDFTIFGDGNAGTVTITLPTAVGITGRIYVIKAIDITNAVSLDGNGTETIDGSAAAIVIVLNESYMVQSDGANWQIISKN